MKNGDILDDLDSHMNMLYVCVQPVSIQATGHAQDRSSINTRDIVQKQRAYRLPDGRTDGPTDDQRESMISHT